MSPTDDLLFVESGKDTSRSCIFAYPDRPIDSFPPDYPPITPPIPFPYDPGLDWPFIPPPDRPIPGIDPHPVPPPPGPFNLNGVTIQRHTYYVFDDNDLPHGNDALWNSAVDGKVSFNIDFPAGSGIIFIPPGGGTLTIKFPVSARYIPRDSFPLSADGRNMKSSGFVLSVGSRDPIFTLPDQATWYWLSWWCQYFNPTNVLDTVRAVTGIATIGLLENDLVDRFVGLSNFHYYDSFLPPPHAGTHDYVTPLVWASNPDESFDVTAT